MQVRRVEERGGKIKYLQNLYVHRLWIDFFKKNRELSQSAHHLFGKGAMNCLAGFEDEEIGLLLIFPSKITLSYTLQACPVGIHA
jgi:hypothetical protein